MTDAKDRPYTVDFVDLDDNHAKLAHLQEANLQDLDVTAEISKLRQKKYQLVDNNFKLDDPNQHEFLVTFKHSYEIIDADHASPVIPRSELRRTGTQTVHYQGAGARTPIDSKTTVEFNRSFVFDQTLNSIVKNNGWTKPHFRIVGTPDVLGYVADKRYVGGEEASVNHPDRDYVVTYQANEHPTSNKVSAVVKFIDLDAKNKELASSDELTGEPYTAIDYSTKPVIDDLQSKGYELVDNGFDPDEQVEFFNSSSAHQQIYFVSFKHQIMKVNSANPLRGVKAAAYEKKITSVVHYVGAGKKSPQDNVQVMMLTRTLMVDVVTKEIHNWSEWRADQDHFDKVVTPAVENFTADKAVVKGQLVNLGNFEETVVYHANSRTAPADQEKHKKALIYIPKLHENE